MYKGLDALILLQGTKAMAHFHLSHRGGFVDHHLLATLHHVTPLLYIVIMELEK